MMDSRGRYGIVNLLPVILIFCLVSAGTGAAEQGNLPFCPGEKFTYRVSWSGILIGYAVLEVLPLAQIDGKPAQHFVLRGKTKGFVDFFYRVHTRIDGFTDQAVTRTVFFKNQISGRHNKRITYEFDWDNQLLRRTENDRQLPPIKILPGTFDLLSVFYFSRLSPMAVNLNYRCPVTDGKKVVIGRVKVVRRETIAVADKKYDTFLLEPETRHIGGVFKRSRNPKIQLWVTADSRRIPVRVRSKVIVGSFFADLVTAEGL